MRKRERENPCGICGHYHKYEEGEVCGVCGHRMLPGSDKAAAAAVHVSAFPSEILPEFLYLGSYDNAAHAELLKTQSITRVVNDKKLPFDDAVQYLVQCEKDRARVLVHCMSGKSRSPAIVMAYLMKSKGWKLAQSYQWVKERRPLVEISQDAYQQLQEYEQRIFGSSSTDNSTQNCLPSSSPSLSFGFSTANNPPVTLSAFQNTPTTSIFSHPLTNVPPQEFTFGAVQSQKSTQATMHSMILPWVVLRQSNNTSPHPIFIYESLHDIKWGEMLEFEKLQRSR